MTSRANTPLRHFSTALPWLTLPWLLAMMLDASRPWIITLVAIGSAIAVLILVRPRWMAKLIVLQHWLSGLAAAMIGEAALLTVFIVVVTPLGLLQRLRGKTLLSMKPEDEATSYWQAANKETSPESFTKRW